MVRQLLASSRFFILIAIVGAFIASIVTLVYGGISVVVQTIKIFAAGNFGSDAAKLISVAFIELIDVFLIGTILYIIALGLYVLFVDKNLPVPHWLEILTLDDLKDKLVGTIVILLVVTFLGEVVEWDGNSDILSLGIAIGLVLLGVAATTLVGHWTSKGKDQANDE